MEWRFAKMGREESRDRSCLAEFFNDSKISSLAVKTYCERLNMLSLGGEEAAE